MTYSPSSPVTAERASLVASLVTFTDPPTNHRPRRVVTVPRIVPR